ncbi:hypothetical protein BGZ83_003120, partial [Gryganskiella cystojenkinii]
MSFRPQNPNQPTPLSSRTPEDIMEANIQAVQELRENNQKILALLARLTEGSQETKPVLTIQRAQAAQEAQEEAELRREIFQMQMQISNMSSQATRNYIAEKEQSITEIGRLGS